jgi:hypothetical protein
VVRRNRTTLQCDRMSSLRPLGGGAGATRSPLTAIGTSPSGSRSLRADPAREPADRGETVGARVSRELGPKKSRCLPPAGRRHSTRGDAYAVRPSVARSFTTFGVSCRRSARSGRTQGSRRPTGADPAPGRRGDRDRHGRRHRRGAARRQGCRLRSASPLAATGATGLGRGVYPCGDAGLHRLHRRLPQRGTARRRTRLEHAAERADRLREPRGDQARSRRRPGPPLLDAPQGGPAQVSGARPAAGAEHLPPPSSRCSRGSPRSRPCSAAPTPA